MNSHSLVTTHLRDEIVNLTHICAADPNVYLRALPEKDKKLIADVRKYYSKGEEPWYLLTRKYLARLLYDVQMTKEYNTKVDQLSRENLSEDDLKKEQEKTYHDVTNKYSDKIGKLLNIVDPHLGSDWLVKVLSLKWGFGSWATLEKLNLIAIVDAPIQNKLLWLSLLEADSLTRAAYGVSQKGKKVVEDTIADVLIEKAMPSSHDIGGSSQLRRVLSFDYPDDISMHGQISHDFSRCIAITGDYIAISGDFSLGVRSPSWALIHEHMLKVIPRDLVYKRSSKSVSWAADCIFLDLPYGGLSSGYSVSPMWDRITEDHVRAGIHLAWNTLSDSEWLVIMASFAGSGRVCGSLDFDDSIITDFLQSMFHSRKRIREEASAPTDLEDESDMPMCGNPFDDFILPAYVQVEARKMASDSRFDLQQPEQPHMRNIFIDDECDSS
ncbi:hypothetical protein L7F22_002947 [Adiantum nelumboides]|nr:hypothetical protein [Adiantum nelumboides]